MLICMGKRESSIVSDKLLEREDIMSEKVYKSPLEPFTRRVLDNGLTVIVKEVHTTPIVAVYFWTRTGSVNESPRLNGISHFFEHMFFKGTVERGVGEMDRAIKELGGYNNAFTGSEYTAYYVVVPSQNFATAFDVLYDATVNSVFDPEEVDRERNVIKEEIKRKEDSPGGKISDMFTEEIFRGSPYQMPILGTDESLDNIGREDFLADLETFYCPNNMVLAIVGDIDEAEIVGEIEKLTSNWKANPEVEAALASFEFEPQEEIRRQVVEKDVNQGYLLIGFPNLGRKKLDDMYTLDVASTILGEGKSSRLHQRLVEKDQLASVATGWLWPLSMAGTLAIEAEFRDENLKKVEEVVIEEVERMRDELVDEDELNKAKTMIKNDFAYSNETDSNIAGTLGQYETISSVEEALEHVERIEKVTAQDVEQAVNEYCDPNAYTLCYLKPKGQENGS